jgi:rhomboid protease GluP
LKEMEDPPDPAAPGENAADGASGPGGRGGAPKAAGPRRCARCGALNGADFDHCIRCASPLAAAPAQRSAPPRDSAGRDRVWAAQIILGLTSLTFAGQLMAAFSRDMTISKALFTGGNEIDHLRFGALPYDLEVVAREPWLLLSCVFVHYGILHFGLNMMGFWSFARVAEPAMGSARLLVAYVAAGLTGSVLTIVLAAADATSFLAGIQRLLAGRAALGVGATLGASGAVFGVMGLVLGWLLRRRDSRWKTFAVEAVLFSVLFGFAVNAAPSSTIVINNAAHLGGLACGVVFGMVYAGRGRKAPPWLVYGSAALCLLACLASLLLAQLSTRWRDIDKSFLTMTHEPAEGSLTIRPATMIAPPLSNV